MISAREAVRESVKHSKAMPYLSLIESYIQESTKNGLRECKVPIDLTEADCEILISTIGKELYELGYTYEYKFALPLPKGCPSDQWDFYNGYIKIKW